MSISHHKIITISCIIEAIVNTKFSEVIYGKSYRNLIGFLQISQILFHFLKILFFKHIGVFGFVVHIIIIIFI